MRFLAATRIILYWVGEILRLALKRIFYEEATILRMWTLPKDVVIALDCLEEHACRHENWRLSRVQTLLFFRLFILSSIIHCDDVGLAMIWLSLSQIIHDPSMLTSLFSWSSMPSSYDLFLILITALSFVMEIICLKIVTSSKITYVQFCHFIIWPFSIQSLQGWVIKLPH